MIHFDTAYAWLFQFEPSSLSPAAAVLAWQAQASLRGFRRAALEENVRRLLDVARASPSVDERAEAHLVCARVAYKFSALTSAEENLEAAAALYRQPFHTAGVAFWLLGTLHALRGSSQALEAFAASMNTFDRIATAYELNHDPRAAWYRRRLREMQHALLDLDARRPARATAAPQPTRPADWMPEYRPEESQAPIPVEMPHRPLAVKAPRSTNGAVNADLYASLFQTFPVSETVPAGGFGASGNDPEPVSFLQFDRALIEGRAHRIYPLKRNGNVIKLTHYLNQGSKFNVVRIRGDSMNRLNIEDGDYVLVVIGAQANHGDIVVAGVQNEDSLATIKRLDTQHGGVVLQPESTNSAHQPIQVRPGDAFRVIGLALAVLKPEPAESQVR